MHVIQTLIRFVPWYDPLFTLGTCTANCLSRVHHAHHVMLYARTSHCSLPCNMQSSILPPRLCNAGYSRPAPPARVGPLTTERPLWPSRCHGRHVEEGAPSKKGGGRCEAIVSSRFTIRFTVSWDAHCVKPQYQVDVRQLALLRPLCCTLLKKRYREAKLQNSYGLQGKETKEHAEITGMDPTSMLLTQGSSTGLTIPHPSSSKRWCQVCLPLPAEEVDKFVIPLGTNKPRNS